MGEWQDEVWRDIPGWDGYQVSNMGRVRSIDRLRRCSADGRTRMFPGTTLKPRTNGYYQCVRLRRGKFDYRMISIHRLVAQCFLSPDPSRPNVNHIDCDRLNNRADNLEWCTQAENLAHSTRLGRMPRDYWINRRSPNANLDANAVQSIRKKYAMGEHSYASLANEFGVSKRAIGRLIKRETYADV
jgi:hypothetical protein